MKRVFAYLIFTLTLMMTFSEGAWAGQKSLLKIVSETPGAKVAVYIEGSRRSYKTCETPCEFLLKTGKDYKLVGEMADGSIIRLPAILDGVVYFDPANRSKTSISLVPEKVSGGDETVLPGEKGPKPLKRVPKPIPHGANKSGHCNMRFDVDKSGRTTNVAADCTEDIFISPSLEAVMLFEYSPQYRVEGTESVPVYTTGLKTKLQYQMLDEYGDLIPE